MYIAVPLRWFSTASDYSFSLGRRRWMLVLYTCKSILIGRRSQWVLLIGWVSIVPCTSSRAIWIVEPKTEINGGYNGIHHHRIIWVFKVSDIQTHFPWMWYCFGSTLLDSRLTFLLCLPHHISSLSIDQENCVLLLSAIYSVYSNYRPGDQEKDQLLVLWTYWMFQKPGQTWFLICH